MLDSFLILNSINDAILILARAKRETASGSAAVWEKVYHAEKHLNAQVGELLAPPPVEEDCTTLSDTICEDCGVFRGNSCNKCGRRAASSDDWLAYDRCAEDLARKGLKGEIGDPLPVNLPLSVSQLINDDPEAFQDRVRVTAYAIAMGKVTDAA